MSEHSPLTYGPLPDPTPEEMMLVDLVKAARAWGNPGPHPSYHREAQQCVRELMPLLGDALDAAIGRWHDYPPQGTAPTAGAK